MTNSSDSSQDSRPRFASCRGFPSFVAELPDALSRVVAAQALYVGEQWLSRRMAALQGTSVAEGKERLRLEIGLLILKSLIFAARADGQIDSLEHGALSTVCAGLCAEFEAAGFIDDMLTRDLNVQEIADAVSFEEECLDIYLLSRLIVDGAHFLEQNYLEELAAALHIAPSQQLHLDALASKLRTGPAPL